MLSLVPEVQVLDRMSVYDWVRRCKHHWGRCYHHWGREGSTRRSWWGRRRFVQLLCWLIIALYCWLMLVALLLCRRLLDLLDFLCYWLVVALFCYWLVALLLHCWLV